MLLFCFIQGKDLLSRSFFILYISIYPAVFWAVRPPPENSAKAKKLGGGRAAARKGPIREG
ncbi:hypothetical protein CN490_10830 [Bacillus cereus]|nr:hypothetical protein CN490_10830 [Bacillus cereus]